MIKRYKNLFCCHDRVDTLIAQHVKKSKATLTIAIFLTLTTGNCWAELTGALLKNTSTSDTDRKVQNYLSSVYREYPGVFKQSIKYLPENNIIIHPFSGKESLNVEKIVLPKELVSVVPSSYKQGNILIDGTFDVLIYPNNGLNNAEQAHKEVIVSTLPAVLPDVTLKEGERIVVNGVKNKYAENALHILIIPRKKHEERVTQHIIKITVIKTESEYSLENTKENETVETKTQNNIETTFSPQPKSALRIDKSGVVHGKLLDFEFIEFWGEVTYVSEDARADIVINKSGYVTQETQKVKMPADIKIQLMSYESHPVEKPVINLTSQATHLVRDEQPYITIHHLADYQAQDNENAGTINNAKALVDERKPFVKAGVYEYTLEKGTFVNGRHSTYIQATIWPVGTNKAIKSLNQDVLMDKANAYLNQFNDNNAPFSRKGMLASYWLQKAATQRIE